MLLRMVKYGTIKVELGPYIAGKPKMRYSWDCNLFKMLK